MPFKYPIHLSYNNLTLSFPLNQSLMSLLLCLWLLWTYCTMYCAKSSLEQSITSQLWCPPQRMTEIGSPFLCYGTLCLWGSDILARSFRNANLYIGYHTSLFPIFCFFFFPLLLHPGDKVNALCPLIIVQDVCYGRWEKQRDHSCPRLSLGLHHGKAGENRERERLCRSNWTPTT